MAGTIVRRRFLAALFAVAISFAAVGVEAQQPVPTDTARTPADTAVFVVPPSQIPADTVVVDTVAGDTAAVVPDSLRAAPTLPHFPRPLPAGWAAAIWEWDRDALQRFHGLSLFELLRDVPGLAITRSGVFGRPAAVTAYGLGGGRTRVFIDGYELDPLASTTVDLQRIALVDLRQVRVERGLDEVRIELSTFEPSDARPYSVVEAATSNDRTRLLRGLFTRPIGARSAIALVFDLVDTEGAPFAQPFSATTAAARWSYLPREQTGVQLEYRQTEVDSRETGFSEQSTYRNLILRGRTRLPGGIAADAIIGRTWRGADDADSLGIDASNTQAAARAMTGDSARWIGGGGRVRFGGGGGFPTSDVELFVRSGIAPFRGSLLSGEARYLAADGAGGVEIRGIARVEPLPGVALFAAAAAGSRGVGFARDTAVFVGQDPLGPDTSLVADTSLVFSTAASRISNLRAGAELTAAESVLGIALLSIDSDRTVPFGLRFDAGVEPLDAARATAAEATVSIAIPRLPLRAEGFYVRALGDPERAYLPQQQWRAALAAHDEFYTGNLEVTARLEAVHRGSARVPNAASGTFTASSDPYTLVNFFLQIRVIDVRAFFLAENLLSQIPADLPTRTFPLQRTLFGLRWHFFN